MNDMLRIVFARENAWALPIGALLGSAVLAGFTSARDLGASGLALALITIICVTMLSLSAREFWLQRRRAVRLTSAIQLVVLAALSAGGIAGTSWLIAKGFAGRVYVTEIGGLEKRQLPDGTVAELNTNTLMRFRISDGRRQVTLERGELLLDVMPDENRPLEVTAGSTRVVALGTEFSVRLHDTGDVETRVREGRVRLDVARPARGSSMILETGDVGRVQGDHVNVRRVSELEMRRLLTWTSGTTLEFDGAPLSEIVNEMNRYNEHKLKVGDPTLSPLQISGSFDPRDPHSFLRFLDERYAISGAQGPTGEVVLKKKSAAGS